jgi:pSer/pThr/pTyr-binding forkhead associated (FHA) protein
MRDRRKSPAASSVPAVEASSTGQADTPLRLRVVEGPQAGEELELTGPAVIGRSSTNAALVIRDSEASRRHASVIPEGNSLNVEDLGSTNGTFVNGERIEGMQTLVAGDQLRIGTTVLELQVVEQAEVAEEAEVAEPPAVAEPAAEVEPEPEVAPEEAEPAAEAEPELAAEPEPDPAELVEAGEPVEAVEPEEAVEAAPEERVEVAAPDEPVPPAEEVREAPPATWASEAAEAKETAKLLHRRLDESFSSVLHAWSNRDVEKMRPYVSGTHLGRASEAADALDRDYQVNYIRDLKLIDVAVRRPTGGAEPVEVYVSFVGRDWIEDLRTSELIEGEPNELQAFIERWTFVQEGRRGWVIDRVESVWTGPAEEGGAAADWPGLPEGWYALRNRPGTWRQWSGSAWEAAPAPTG